MVLGSALAAIPMIWPNSLTEFLFYPLGLLFFVLGFYLFERKQWIVIDSATNTIDFATNAWFYKRHKSETIEGYERVAWVAETRHLGVDNSYVVHSIYIEGKEELKLFVHETIIVDEADFFACAIANHLNVDEPLKQIVKSPKESSVMVLTDKNVKRLQKALKFLMYGFFILVAILNAIGFSTYRQIRKARGLFQSGEYVRAVSEYVGAASNKDRFSKMAVNEMRAEFKHTVMEKKALDSLWYGEGLAFVYTADGSIVKKGPELASELAELSEKKVRVSAVNALFLLYVAQGLDFEYEHQYREKIRTIGRKALVEGDKEISNFFGHRLNLRVNSFSLFPDQTSRRRAANTILSQLLSAISLLLDKVGDTNPVLPRRKRSAKRLLNSITPILEHADKGYERVRKIRRKYGL